MEIGLLSTPGKGHICAHALSNQNEDQQVAHSSNLPDLGYITMKTLSSLISKSSRVSSRLILVTESAK